MTALEALPGPDFIIDGELVIQNEHGHPIFQRLAQGFQAARVEFWQFVQKEDATMGE